MSVQSYLKSKGWKFNSEFRGVFKFEKGNVWEDGGRGAFLDYDENLDMVKISITDDGFNMNGPNISPKYNGLYQNNETFDMICDLIKLKL